jgi:hypothetical protein
VVGRRCTALIVLESMNKGIERKDGVRVGVRVGVMIGLGCGKGAQVELPLERAK